jgi:hypothetical protein
MNMDTERMNKGLLDCGCGFAMDKETDEDGRAIVAAILSPDCAIHKDQKQVEAYLLEAMEHAAGEHTDVGGIAARDEDGLTIQMKAEYPVVSGSSKTKKWELAPCGCQYRFSDPLSQEEDGSGQIPLDLRLTEDCTEEHTYESLNEHLQEAALVGITAMRDDRTDGDCPICMNWIPTNDKKGEYPGAMSRFDRDEDEPTEICSACGTAEGFILFHLGDDDELRDAMCEDWGLWRAAVLIQRDMLKVRE